MMRCQLRSDTGRQHRLARFGREAVCSDRGCVHSGTRLPYLQHFVETFWKRLNIRRPNAFRGWSLPTDEAKAEEYSKQSMSFKRPELTCSCFCKEALAKLPPHAKSGRCSLISDKAKYGARQDSSRDII